jgi:predicted GIY-YIG superfamily endonuclease
VVVVYQENVATRSDAQKREFQIKRLRRKVKEQLAQGQMSSGMRRI